MQVNLRMAFQFVLGRAGSGKTTSVLEAVKQELVKQPEGSPLIWLVPEQATSQAEGALVASPELRGSLRAQVLSFRRLAWRVMQEVGGIARLPIDDTGKKLLIHRIIQKNKALLKLYGGTSGQAGFLDKMNELFVEWKRYNLTSDRLEDWVSWIMEHEGSGQAPRQKTEPAGACDRSGEQASGGNAPAGMPQAEDLVDTEQGFRGAAGFADTAPTSLEAAASRTLSPAMQDKLHDLMCIYGEFETELSKQYLDGEGYLELLAEQAGESDYLREAEIWIDGFHGFTPQEYSVLIELAKHARSVTLTLCLDREYQAGEQPEELNLFHPTARTMSRLSELLLEAGVEVLPARRLDSDPPIRLQANAALAHLEREWGAPVKRAFTQEHLNPSSKGVHITASVNRRAEAEAVTREIVRLVRDEGLRYRDIAVSIRNIEAYGDLLAGTLHDYGVPYFFDQKRPVMHHPLVELIRSSLEAVTGGWRYDAVFRSVKTEFFLPYGDEALVQCGDQEVYINRQAMDQLENVVLAFGIRGSAWTQPGDWTYSFKTKLEEETPESTQADQAWLALMNACRRRIADPLKKLQDRLGKGRTIRDKTEAVFSLLLELQAPERLETWSREALKAGQPEKAREHAQVWDRVIDVLDQLVELMGSENASNELFAQLIDTGLESIKLGLVPPALDQVLIGSMDRTRSGEIKHLFVLGVNDGVMPAKIKENGLLTEREREQLAKTGLALAESAARRLLDEQFLIYSAFCTPSEGLWLSYALADEEGKSLLPSEVIRSMKRLFPQVRERLVLTDPASDSALTEQLSYVAGSSKALSHLLVRLKQWTQGQPMNDIWWSVYNWFTRQPEEGDRLQAVLPSLSFSNEEAPLSKEASRLLYGDLLQTSVSRMERFIACPFSHFASHGLRLKERRLFRLDAPDVGQLFHAALRSFTEKLEQEGVDWGALTPDEVLRRASMSADELAPRLQGEILLSSKRFEYIAGKLKQVIGQSAVMLGEHAKHGKFRPIALEAGFGRGELIPSLEYELDNGVKMELRGRIDRIDRADTAQGAWLRVLDYKSSSKPLNLSEVYYGLSLQMLAYLDVLLTHSPIWLGEEAKPAGVLYFHIHHPVLSSKNRISADEAAKELKKKFKMKGLLAAEPEIVRLMDDSIGDGGGRSELLPAGIKGDGSFYKTSSVATASQWESVRKHVRQTLRKAGTMMTEGAVDIAPYRMGKAAACQLCAYKPVCGFDTQLEGNAHRVLPPLPKDAVWPLLEAQAEEQDTAELSRTAGHSGVLRAVRPEQQMKGGSSE